MKTGWVKIMGMAALIVLLVSGVSFGGGYRGDHYRGHHGHGYHGWHGGHHWQGHHHHHQRYYRPSVVYERYYYPAPPRVYYPAPGSYFGMSVTQPGVSFGFGFHN